jgi:hypothetical protein
MNLRRRPLLLIGFLSLWSLLVGCSASTGHIFSTVIPVALTDRKPGTNTAGQKGFVVDLSIPQLTDQVVNTDGVAVYYMFEGSDRYEPLPLVFNGVIYHAYHSKGKLSLRMFSANGGNLEDRPPSEVTAFKAKIVIF